MRVSSYMIGSPIPEQDFYVLLHGYTGAVDKVASSVGRFLVEQRGRDVDDVSSPLTGMDEAERRALADRGYLTSMSHAEERQVLLDVTHTLHADAVGSSIPSITFVPTYLCNLRCPYCFQPHTMHQGRGAFSSIMTNDQVDRVFEIAHRVCQPGGLARLAGLPAAGPVATGIPPGMTFGLFGGEPLARAAEPVIRYIVGRVREVKGKLFAITNGVDLDAFTDLLGPDGIAELQITLDGAEQRHNKRRIGPGLTSTFSTITANIDRALMRGVKVSIRTNVDRSNLDDLAELDRTYAARGWYGYPAFDANAACVTPEGAHESLLGRDELTRHTTALHHAQGSRIDAYERYARDVLNQCVQGEGYPFRRVTNCSAETGLLMFDPLGDVYSCWEDIGDTAHRVGIYGAFGLRLLPEAARAWLSRFPGAIDECSNCPYAMVHASGCAKHARSSTGTMFASDCDAFQTLFPESLGEAYARLERRILDPDVRETSGDVTAGIAPCGA